MPIDDRDHSLSQSAARKLLRSNHLRCTAARMAILQCLDGSQGPLSAAAVAERVAAYGFDKSTIYRALTDLNGAGLVTRLDIGDGPRHFELSPATGDEHQAHPHFVCLQCNHVCCLAPSQVALKEGPRGAAFPGDATEVLVKGLCKNCR
jgi:Fur family ferric uptake transcriptional regulator